MKRASIAAFSLFLALSAFADPLDDQLDAAVAAMTKDFYQAHMFVSIDPITYEESGMGSPFAAYLGDKLSSSIVRHEGTMSLYVHDALENRGPELADAFSGVISEKNIRQGIGGKYYDRGLSVHVSLRAIDYSTGVMIGAAEFDVPKGSLPSQATLLPANYDTALNAMRDIGELLAGRQSGFAVRATTTRGNGATYREGESFVITLAANKDCWIKIFHVDTKGEMQLIFPEAGYDNFVKAQRLYTVPDADYPIDFEVQPPFGTEQLKIIASTTRFDSIEPAFVKLGRARKDGFVSMDLGGKKRPDKDATEALNAECSVIYTTVPKR